MPAHVYGSGYTSVSRLCHECGHSEALHYGPCTRCACGNFAARKLSRAERKIMRGRGAVKVEKIEVRDEITQLVEDYKKHKVEGVE